jgi:hypothetical protein
MVFNSADGMGKQVGKGKRLMEMHKKIKKETLSNMLFLFHSLLN